MSKKSDTEENNAEEKKIKKTGSFAFYLSIPLSFFLFLLLLFQILASPFHEVIVFFLMTLLIPFILLSFKRSNRFTVFIHEMKHAVLIFLSGAEVTQFQVSKESGRVHYKIPKDVTQRMPFIALAPYYFPLFSLPTLIGAALFHERCPFLLGFMLGIDLRTALHELHPRQTDLQRIYGGWPVILLFLIGVNLAWAGVVTLWILTGQEGFEEFILSLVRVGSVLFEEFTEMLRYWFMPGEKLS